MFRRILNPILIVGIIFRLLFLVCICVVSLLQVIVRIIAGIELNPEFVDFVRDLVEKIEPCQVTSQVRVRLPFAINPEENP